MGRRQLFINVLAVLVLFFAAFVFTYFSGPIRKSIYLSQKMVAGASVDKGSLESELPNTLVKDAGNHATYLKERVLQIELGQVIDFLGRTGKIIQDVKEVPALLEQTVQSLTKK